MKHAKQVSFQEMRCKAMLLAHRLRQAKQTITSEEALQIIFDEGKRRGIEIKPDMAKQKYILIGEGK